MPHSSRHSQASFSSSSSRSRRSSMTASSVAVPDDTVLMRFIRYAALAPNSDDTGPYVLTKVQNMDQTNQQDPDFYWIRLSPDDHLDNYPKPRFRALPRKYSHPRSSHRSGPFRSPSPASNAFYSPPPETFLPPPQPPPQQPRPPPQDQARFAHPDMPYPERPGLGPRRAPQPPQCRTAHYNAPATGGPARSTLHRHRQPFYAPPPFSFAQPAPQQFFGDDGDGGHLGRGAGFVQLSPEQMAGAAFDDWDD